MNLKEKITETNKLLEYEELREKLREKLLGKLEYEEIFKRYVNDREVTLEEHFRTILLLSWNWDLYNIDDDYDILNRNNIKNIDILKDIIDTALEDINLRCHFTECLHSFRGEVLEEIFKKMKIKYDICSINIQYKEP